MSDVIISDGLIYTIEQDYMVVKQDPDNKPSGAVSILNEISTFSGVYPVKRIDHSAFHSNYNITSIDIPPNVKAIGDAAFSNCYGLTTVTGMIGVEYLEDSFTHCTALKSISIYNLSSTLSGVQNYRQNNLAGMAMGYSCFYYCTALTAFNLLVDKSASTISSLMATVVNNWGIFGGPARANKITFNVLPSRINEISSTQGTVFTSTQFAQNCQLSTLISRTITVPTIPIQIIGDNYQIYPHVSYSVESDIISYTIDDPSIATVDGNGYVMTNNIGTATITVSVSQSRQYSAASMTINLTVVDNFIKINSITYTREGNYAKAACYGSPRPSGAVSILNEVTIGSKILPVKVIDMGGFSNNTNLTSIHIPDNIKIIGEGAFYNCTALTNVTGMKGVQYIDENAFKNTGITTITIYDLASSVAGLLNYTSNTFSYDMALGYNVFKGCSALTTVNLLVDKDITTLSSLMAGQPEFLINWNAVGLTNTTTRTPKVTFNVLPSRINEFSSAENTVFTTPGFTNNAVLGTYQSNGILTLTVDKFSVTSVGQTVSTTVIPSRSLTGSESYSFVSSNPAVATVASDGTVIAVGAGSAEITVSVGAVSASQNIVVVASNVSQSFSITEGLIPVGVETFASFTPTGGSQSLTYIATSLAPVSNAGSNEVAYTPADATKVAVTVSGLPAEINRVTIATSAPVNNTVSLYIDAYQGTSNIHEFSPALTLQFTIPGAVAGETYTFVKYNADGSVKTTYSNIAVQEGGVVSIPNVSSLCSYSGTKDSSSGGGSGSGVPCFPAGTKILTAAGYKAVETLGASDRVVTADGRSVAFKLYKTVVEKATKQTAPFVIKAGAFGRSSPAADITLSPLHAIQSAKGVWQIPKYAALENAGVQQYGVGASVTYYHVELPNFFTDNIVAEGGAVVESFGAKQCEGMGNIYKYNATLGGFTRATKAASKAAAK